MLGKTGQKVKIFANYQFNGKIYAMVKLHCRREEYEQFKAIHAHFSFFFDPKPEIPDSKYSLRKTELIREVTDFWPIFQRLCKELNISLEIENRPLFYSPAAKINYARAFCGRTDFVEDKPIPKRLLDLDIMVKAIKRCTRSGQPEVNMWEISNNLGAKIFKDEAWQCNQLIMRQMKEIFDELLIHLRKCFGEEIETQISVPEPAEIERNATKRGRLKPILCAISGLVVFLAAMLTIFHLLGWLEPIRAFISNIVSNN